LAQTTTLERRILALFFTTVGAELGLYDFKQKKFAPGAASHGAYQENLRAIQQALGSGTPAADLEELIRERYRAGERTALIGALLKAETRPGRAGLETDLLTGIEPLHPALFDRRMPVLTLVGQTLTEVSAGRVTPKAQFTLAQLIDYYAAALRGYAPRLKQHLGPWNWLLSQATLPELLTAIDLAREEHQEPGPLELTQYLAAARPIVQARAARRGETNP
jgi:hypothetical protein